MDLRKQLGALFATLLKKLEQQSLIQHSINGASKYFSRKILFAFFEYFSHFSSAAAAPAAAATKKNVRSKNLDEKNSNEKNSDEKIRTKKNGGQGTGARHGRCGGKARVINGDSWGAKPPRPPRGARHG